MKRSLVLGLLGAGALALVIGANLTASSGGVALGWAAAAGSFFMLMLRGPGIRAVGILLVLLGAGAAALAVLGGGTSLFLLVPAALLVSGGVAAARWGPGWQPRAGSGPREAPRDHWKQFDAGEDPTAGDGHVVPDEDPR